MIVAHTITELREAIRTSSGTAKLALVPTMGALHEGHLRLVNVAAKATGNVVMSAFVNPIQFRPGEDLDSYPSSPERDHELAAASGVNILFTPSTDEMYRNGSEIRVVPGRLAELWEGAIRPGHFAGVLTVVAKLLNLVRPDVVVFGQKDIQQVVLVKRMIAELEFGTTLLTVPTVRETDGLALSSRNIKLTSAARISARVLSASLRTAQEMFQAGTRDAAAIKSAVAMILESEPGVEPDYIAVTDPENMEPVISVTKGSVVAIAARVGATRLIDNVILGEVQD
jgi:pantoate--beta-alanine ligase